MFVGLGCPTFAKLLSARRRVVAKLGKQASEASKTINTAKFLGSGSAA